jgi:hypothetical protein
MEVLYMFPAISRLTFLLFELTAKNENIVVMLCPFEYFIPETKYPCSTAIFVGDLLGTRSRKTNLALFRIGPIQCPLYRKLT